MVQTMKREATDTDKMYPETEYSGRDGHDLTIHLDTHVRKACNRLTVAKAKAYPLSAKLDTCPN